MPGAQRISGQAVNAFSDVSGVGQGEEQDAGPNRKRSRYQQPVQDGGEGEDGEQSAATHFSYEQMAHALFSGIGAQVTAQGQGGFRGHRHQEKDEPGCSFRGMDCSELEQLVEERDFQEQPGHHGQGAVRAYAGVLHDLEDAFLVPVGIKAVEGVREAVQVQAARQKDLGQDQDDRQEESAHPG